MTHFTMLPFHHFTVRTFCHATESLESVSKALRELVGEAEVVQTKLEGHHGNPIIQLEARLVRAPEVRVLWTRLLADAALRERLKTEVGARLDDSLNFYFRLDKQEAFQGRLALSDGDDTIQCRGKVKVFPAHRSEAEKLLDAALSAG